MRVSEAVLTVVREWILKADHDLTAAAQILKLGKATPTETVGFHAQQCVEKYLKAILVYRTIPFAKTHVIRDLMGLVPRRYRPALDDVTQIQLTRYASVTRYPDSGRIITLSAARKAVTTARRVRREGSSQGQRCRKGGSKP
jgi:HEPN domain-containing protein